MNHVCSDLTTFQNWHYQTPHKTDQMKELRQDFPIQHGPMPSTPITAPWTALKKNYFQEKGGQKSTSFNSNSTSSSSNASPLTPEPSSQKKEAGATQVRLFKPRPRRSSEILSSPRRTLWQGAEQPSLSSTPLYSQPFALCASIDSELGLLAQSTSSFSSSSSSRPASGSMSELRSPSHMHLSYASPHAYLSSELYMDNDPEIESMTLDLTRSLHFSPSLLEIQARTQEESSNSNSNQQQARSLISPSSEPSQEASCAKGEGDSETSAVSCPLLSPCDTASEQQAIVVTDAQFTILAVNAHLSSLLGHSSATLVGISAYSLFVPLYRRKIEKALVLSSLSTLASSHFLFSGKMMRVCRANGTTMSVSVWMKEAYDAPSGCQPQEESKKIYLILKDITELRLALTVDANAQLVFNKEKDAELFDEVFGSDIKSVFEWIPSLHKKDAYDQDNAFCPRRCATWLLAKRFLTARTMEGLMVPIMLSQSMTSPAASQTETDDLASCSAADASQAESKPAAPFLELISLQNISGVIKISPSGLIKSCSTIFTKYLFGYSATELKNKQSITNLLPEYFEYFEKWKHRSFPFLSSAQRVPFFLSSSTTATATADVAVSEESIESTSTSSIAASSTAATPPPPSFLTLSRSLNTSPVHAASSSHQVTAYHADGSHFTCQLEILPWPCNQGGTEATPSALTVCSSYVLRIHYARPSRWMEYKSTLNKPRLTLKARETAFALAQLCSPPPSPPQIQAQALVQKRESPQNSRPTTPNSLLAASLSPAQTHVQTLSQSLTRPDLLALLESPPSSHFSSPYLSPLSMPSTQRWQRNHPNPYLIGETYFPSQLSEYRMIRKMGEGAYGSVHLAVIRKDPLQRKLVIKYIVKSRILPDGWTELPLCRLPPESKAFHPFARNLLQFPLEIHILDALRKSPHPCLMELLYYFEDERHYYIVSELFDQGLDLFDFIDKMGHLLSPHLTRHIFWQVVKAVTHLQGHHMLHRDIKDENIIIDSEGHVKLIDFGSATFYAPGRRLARFCGTMDYAAPEVLSGRGYEGPPQEVWALGILLYTLLYKENPFRSMDEIMSRPPRLTIPSSSSCSSSNSSNHNGLLFHHACHLIQWMLQKEPTKRPTLEQILNHPYLNFMHE